MPWNIHLLLLPLLGVVGVLGREVGFVVIPLPAGLPFVGTTVDGFLDFRETLDIDEDAVFNVGFSVVEGRGGAGHQDMGRNKIFC